MVSLSEMTVGLVLLPVGVGSEARGHAWAASGA